MESNGVTNDETIDNFDAKNLKSVNNNNSEHSNNASLSWAKPRRRCGSCGSAVSE